jgi:hypothetical protein
MGGPIDGEPCPQGIRDFSGLVFFAGVVVVAIVAACAPRAGADLGGPARPDAPQRFVGRTLEGKDIGLNVYTLRDTKTGACWLVANGGGLTPAPKETCE